MIITCPHCQTKYQVTYEAIGSAGRKVQCAQCRKAWEQQPEAAPPVPVDHRAAEAEADLLFDAMAEDALDEIMASEERAVAAERPPEPAARRHRKARTSESAEQAKRQADFSRRQNAMFSRLPLARLRRAARIAGLVILVGGLAGAYFGRIPIVERYPTLAGLYDAIGLGVNVVGLEFSNVDTLRTLSNGSDVLMVSAQIVGRSAQPVTIPPVVVSLLDAEGHAVYEWSVRPRVNDLMAGERATFDTRLSLPPSEAVRVRLSFAGSNWVSDAPAGATASAPASASHAIAPPPEPAPSPTAHH